VVGGYQPAGDAKLHADVVWRAQGGGEQLIVSADTNVGKGSDAGAPGTINATLPAGAVPARCGEQLILRIKMVSGSNDYVELNSSLTLP
jgi:hypothetical protein